MDSNFKNSLTLKVDWADLDLFAHVNNVIFFNYIQSARVNYCELIGLTSLRDERLPSFMVADSHCQFKKPLVYPNTIQIFVKVDWIKTTSFQLSYQLVNSESVIVAIATDVLVIFDHFQSAKLSMPSSVREKIHEIEGRTF